MDHFYNVLSVKYVYIDESGNTSIATDKAGATPLYVPAAVVLDEKDIHEASLQAEGIRRKFFNQGPIKSKSITREDKRIQILEEINKIPFRYFFMVIDKQLLDRESGLKYRPVFYKFINKQLYSHFLRVYSKLKIFVDNYGNKEFQESFKNYIVDKFNAGLFNEPEIEYLSGKDDNFIGVADFLSGTIRLVLENKLKQRTAFSKLINQKVIYSDRWPVSRELDREGDILQGFDHFIRDVSIFNARRFIENNCEDPDSYVRMQCAVLAALLKEVSFDEDEHRGLYAVELLANLQDLDFKVPSERVLRQQVIGPLRDHGILITGSSKGYYLATSAYDIKQFLSHGKSIIFPMLGRIDKACTTLKESSLGKCDILSPEMGDMKLLKNLIDLLKNEKIGFTQSDELEESLYHIEQGDRNVPTEKLSK